ncbi:MULTISPECIES: cytochrome c peroxidase [unclassified Sphingomonas]|uniref:cytochrome-c peroxidase n=1 Tax=unclassified Sphingomonas TaxID=196159 RepID=UPI00226AC421|nr:MULTISPECIES: cytochrome c peroxidase [unclassified Sphingomonas]
MPSASTPATAPSSLVRARRLLVLAGLGCMAAILLGLAVILLRPQAAPRMFDRLVENVTGANPHPVVLIRPPVQPLTALATIGQRIFNDPSLSASGQQSCASCHSAAHAYGPPNGRFVQLGGPQMIAEGLRPPPTLTYLYRQTAFAIGPAADEDAPIPLDQLAAQAAGTQRATKAAGVATTSVALVPRGGLFWDGRSDTLMAQATGPMMDPAEMANKDVADVARKLVRAGYPRLLEPLFGKGLGGNAEMLFAEAMSALSRYQIEDRSFHRFDSKYDQWLEGHARLSHAEMRGLRLFNDPAKGNCAACHLSQPGADGMPPLFTDTEYEALGVPRNRGLAANRDPHHVDMGLCGPRRTDLARQTQYCGMFLTPTLRNAATRGIFFHNGVYHSLRQVLDFYNLRATDPARIYPHDARGHVALYDDLPARYRANIDTADAPFDRKPGEQHPMTDAEIEDIIAFLGTLTDGYRARAG